MTGRGSRSEAPGVVSIHFIQSAEIFSIQTSRAFHYTVPKTCQKLKSQHFAEEGSLAVEQETPADQEVLHDDVDEEAEQDVDTSFGLCLE